MPVVFVFVNNTKAAHKRAAFSTFKILASVLTLR